LELEVGVDDVTVGDDVALAFDAELSRLLVGNLDHVAIGSARAVISTTSNFTTVSVLPY
jgi:hypothetical protein